MIFSDAASPAVETHFVGWTEVVAVEVALIELID
jgi:hypothetical protein